MVRPESGNPMGKKPEDTPFMGKGFGPVAAPDICCRVRGSLKSAHETRLIRLGVGLGME